MLTYAYVMAVSWFINILAQADATGGSGGDGGVDWVSYLLNGGPFAVVVLLIILDKLTPPGERDRLRAENQVLRDEIKVLNQNIREEIVPPLVQLNTLMKDVVEELADIRRDERGKR